MNEATKMDTSTTSPTRRSYRHEYIAAFVVCLSPMAMGSAYGYTSPAMVQLTSSFNLDEQQESLIGSLVFIGALLGGLVAGILADILGRKTVILLNCLPYIIGWIVMATAQNVAMLYSARVITGISCGITSLAAPIYIAEIASPEVRGLLGAAFVVFANLGLLCAYIVGSFLPWDSLAFTLLAFPALLFVLIFWLPETPSWLVRKGRTAQAINAINWLRDQSGNSESECSSIERALAAESKMAVRDFFDSSLLHPLGVIFGEMVVQQFCGNTPVLINAAAIFRSATDSLDPNTAAILVGLCASFSSVVAFVLMDRAGRRPLLLFSGAVMCVTLIIFDSFYYLKSSDWKTAESIWWLPIACLITFIFAFNVGFASIPWLMMGEVFRPQARGLASSFITALTWTMAFISTKTFIDLQNAIGSYGVFWFFSGVCLFAVIFVYCFVPETKGKTLEEVQQYFNRGRLINDVEHSPQLVQTKN